MFTQKFKVTVGLSIATVLFAGLIANQLIEHKQIKTLQEEFSIQPKTVEVMVTPKVTPTATPSATPTLKVVHTPVKVVPTVTVTK